MVRVGKVWFDMYICLYLRLARERPFACSYSFVFGLLHLKLYRANHGFGIFWRRKVGCGNRRVEAWSFSTWPRNGLFNIHTPSGSKEAVISQICESEERNHHSHNLLDI
jgi:hypothetical protein